MSLCQLVITIYIFISARDIHMLTVSLFIFYSQLTNLMILFRYTFMHFLCDVTKFTFLCKYMQVFFYNMLSVGWQIYTLHSLVL